MLPYTPTPVDLPSELSLPQDVADNVIVATVNPNTSALADAIAYRRAISRSWFSASINNGDYDGDWPLEYTLIEAGDAFGTPIAIAGVDSDEIVIPKAGVYQISWSFLISYSTATNWLPLVVHTTADNTPLLSMAGFCDAPATDELVQMVGTGLLRVPADGNHLVVGFQTPFDANAYNVPNKPAVSRTLHILRID